MINLNTEQYLHVLLHLKSAENIGEIYNYLNASEIFGKEFKELADSEKQSFVDSIVAQCSSEPSEEDLILLAIARGCNIPFDEVKKLPSAIGKYLLASLKNKLQQKKPNENYLSTLLKSSTQKSNAFKSPDGEITNIFLKNFGEDFAKKLKGE